MKARFKAGRMKVDASLLVKCFGNTPKVRIIDFLIDNIPFDYSKKEIIEGSGIAKVTLMKIWKDLVDFEIVLPTRKFGKAQLYTINSDDPVIKVLMEKEFELGKRALEQEIAVKA